MVAILAGASNPAAIGTGILSSVGDFVLSSSRGSVALDGDIVLLEGSSIFGPTATTPDINDALGLDGGFAFAPRPFRREVRTLDLLMHVQGTDARHRRDLIDALVRVLTPLDGTLVTFGARRIDGDFVTLAGVVKFTGNGPDFGPLAAWDDRAVITCSLVCPDPLWKGARRTARAATVIGGAFFPILPLTLDESSGLGSPVALDVGGDAPAWVEHRITGPAAGVRCTNAAGAAWEVAFPSPLSGTPTVTVRTDPRVAFDGLPRVASPAGGDWTRYLTTDRRLFALNPDGDSVTHVVTGGGGGTVVEMAWSPRYEAIN